MIPTGITQAMMQIVPQQVKMLSAALMDFSKQALL